MGALLAPAQLWRLAALLAAGLPALTLATLLVPYSATATAAAGAISAVSLCALLERRGEPPCWSRLVLALGVVGAGATALAARAPLDQYLSVHLSAVAVLGLTGGAMCCVLTVLTPPSQPRLKVLRWALLATAAAFVAAFAGVHLAKPSGYQELQLRADAACNVTVLAELGWRPGTAPFTIQLVIATSEWSWLMLLSVFVATFSGELQRQADELTTTER
ncbi:hypothetical protein FJT64_017209 [Amphibalanus amphitrite]|uniref:CWH43-like N-terminal domain-containing protein n=1 Tax=Amphibalanus amphitrite TaxID=1232801 RepID=A0A6A4X3D6_AMPAM|nr:hypothetical protein FJT64_017209 [Amphibalanus amphitrite]